MPEKSQTRPGRNEPCHCGSGKKYKRCCLAKDEAADAKAREKREKTERVAAEKAAKAAEKAREDGEEAPAAAETREPEKRRAPRPGGDQPWKRSTQNTRGFQKFSGPRKVGSG